MAAYLKLLGVDYWGNELVADLQIGVNQATNGGSVGWFELKGKNGGTDAGTWEWESNEYGFLIMKMRSHQHGVTVAERHAREWHNGYSPPPKPSIRMISQDTFKYIFPKLGRQVSCDWRVVKMVGAEF